MAVLQHINFEPQTIEISTNSVCYSPSKSIKAVKTLPQIFFKNGHPWQEANLWATERATSQEVSIKTVQANMVALHHYCNWFEDNDIDWLEIPVKKQDRCLVRYRGALISAREASHLAPSTVSERMSSVIKFYRWLIENRLLSPASPLWNEQTVKINYVNKVGFEKFLLRATTNLSIPNRKHHGEKLEGGLLPVSQENRDQILELAREHCSQEIFLMLSIGFFTGMRLGTITDLKIQTLERAVPDPASGDLYRIAVGPGATPSVSTKFGVTGQIWAPRQLLEELKEYAYSVRRLDREAKAAAEHKDHLFLTRSGNPYGRPGGDRSSAVNVEMHKLRGIGAKQGVLALRNFRFHQTRCTFGTELARIGLSLGSPINAIALVRSAMLHKSEATTFLYIKFVQNEPIKKEMANSFTKIFIGVLGSNK